MNKQLEMSSGFFGKVMLELEISSYMDNNRLYIGLVQVDGEFSEHFADLTVNINAKCPDYCGYVDTNKCPELEEFILEHNLGEFTGIVGSSGFCAYPLYMFHVDKLREVAPDDMEHFERTVMGIEPEKEKENNIMTGGR
jgi:hypothetical protein